MVTGLVPVTLKREKCAYFLIFNYLIFNDIFKLTKDCANFLKIV